MVPPPIENHCKLFAVDDRDLLFVVSSFSEAIRAALSAGGEHYIPVPRVAGVPQGAMVAAMFPDHACRRNLFKVHHLDFDEIKRGSVLPIVPTVFEYEVVHVRVTSAESFEVLELVEAD